MIPFIIIPPKYAAKMVAGGKRYHMSEHVARFARVILRHRGFKRWTALMR